MIWQASALGLVLLGIFAAWLAHRRYRASARAKRDGITSARGKLREMARNTLRKNKPTHGRLMSGLWAHIQPPSSTNEKVPASAFEMIRKETGAQKLIQIGLEDLGASDHPSAAVFYEIVEARPDELPLSSVCFTINHELLSKRLVQTLLASGLRVEAQRNKQTPGDAPESTPPSSTGGLVVEKLGHQLDLPVARLLAEAAATATPIEIIALDEARRLKCDLTMLDAFTKEARKLLGEEVVEIKGEQLLIHHHGSVRAVSFHQKVLAHDFGPQGASHFLSELCEGLAKPPFSSPTSLESTAIGRRFRGLATLANESLALVDRGGYVETFFVSSEEGSSELSWSHPLAAKLGADGLVDVAEANPDPNSFSGRFFAVKDESQRASAWVIVGPDAASIAQHPALLSRASRLIGGPPAGSRARIYTHREDVLIIATPNVSSRTLVSCRIRAALFFLTVSTSRAAPLLLDINTNLGEKGAGQFDLLPLDERFFEASERALRARFHGDLAGASTARAMARLALGDPTGARIHLEEAERLAPENGEILLALGTLLNEMGDHRAAERVLRRAIGLDLENPATNNNLGVAYQGLGRLAEAQLFFEKAAEVRPGDSVARVNLGRARLDSGEPIAAERSFMEALERDPRSAAALTGLVLVAVREGDYALARERLGTALGIAPKDAGLLRLHQVLYPNDQAH